MYRSGVIALVGRPNAGKSTLLNSLLGQKVTITSNKVQTTRYQVRGILSVPKRMQAILIDTPGLSKAQDAMGEFMVEESLSALKDADVICWLIDASLPPGKGEIWLAEQVIAANKPFVMLLNKTDKLKDKNDSEARRLEYQNLLAQMKVPPSTKHQMLMISALTQKRIKSIEQAFLRLLPPGEAFYDEDTVTDQNIRQIAEELIREQVMRQTDEEIPHAIAVQITQFDESESPEITRIYANIYTETQSQKLILVGEKGSKIKEIGTESRKTIEKLIEHKVFLDLQVKVKDNWRKDRNFLKSLGLSK